MTDIVSLSIPVAINNLERYGLMQLAKQRNERKEAKGVRSQKIDPNITDVQLHYIGLKAEYAVGKLMGIEMDLSNTYQGDGGVDLTYRGLKIDVKLSTWDLKYRLDREMVADIIILAQPLKKSTRCGKYYVAAETDPVVDKKVFAWKNVLVVGWITREEFFEICEVVNFGHANCNMVRADKMHSMDTLKAYTIARKRESELKKLFKSKFGA